MHTVFVGLCCLLSSFLIAQGDSYSKSVGERPNIQAVALDDTPQIDGEILHDPVWQKIHPIAAMWQSKPSIGSPASERTEIRIAYSSTTLYLSAVCYDSEPKKLVAADNRRDASLDNMDAFLFILDTYHDGQNGFVFGTNIEGLEYDAQVTNEGIGGFGGGRQRGGSIGGFNLNWDGSWQVKTQVGDFGWSAEFAIPLRTLRFAAGNDKVWGINFRRNIQKNNEIDYWASLPLEFNLNRVSLAGTVSNLHLKSPGNLKLIPYVLSSTSIHNTGSKSVQVDFDAGADMKYSVSPSMTLDITYHPDFAQVEVDDEQINLDRFNLFFPEKRPFFLENAGLFSVGSPGEVDLFFSRRIGIAEGGSVVPISAGARLSGKINKTNIGLLSMFTESRFDVQTPKNNFSAARISHEFKARSSVGALFVSKQPLGSEIGHFNRTYAIDGKWGLGQKAQLSGFIAKTKSPNDLGDNYALKMQARYDWKGWLLNAAYTEVARSFNPEVGFLRRTAFRKPEVLIFRRIRPKDFHGFLEFRPHVSYRGFWGIDGYQETGFLHIDNHWVWKNGLEIHTGINFTTEGVRNDFTLVEVLVPKGVYKHKEAQIVFRTNASKTLSISTFHRLGGFFGGKRYANRVSLNLRLGDKFNAVTSVNNNIIQLPGGDFNTNIFSSRLSYSFTPRTFAQALIQYNSVTNKWSANVRFGKLRDANTGLFLVLNTATESFLIKYSRVIELIK